MTLNKKGHRLAKMTVCVTAFTIALYFNYEAVRAFIKSYGFNDDCTSLSGGIRGGGALNNNYPYKEIEDNDLPYDKFQLANDQSFGFFHDVTTNQWKLHQFIVSNHERYHNPDDPLEFVPGRAKNTRWSSFNSAEAFYGSNYEPNFSCAFERRVGGNGNGDGPKWVCDPHRLKRLSSIRKEAMMGSNDINRGEKQEGCLVYSIGSQGDFQFEAGLQELLGEEDACEIHTFDFGNFEGKMPKNMNIHYHQWGLKASDDTITKDEKFLTLAEIVKELGHEKRTIDIFKIDCETCEWNTVKDWFGPGVPMIQQILVETHGVPIALDRTPLSFFNGILDSGYVMFHKEPNIQFAKGSCIEFGFLKLHDDFFADA